MPQKLELTYRDKQMTHTDLRVAKGAHFEVLLSCMLNCPLLNSQVSHVCLSKQKQSTSSGILYIMFSELYIYIYVVILQFFRHHFKS